jgi:hypothetical protein
MINGTPEVMSLAIDFHKHLIKMPFLIRIILWMANALLTDFSDEEWAKSITPITNCFVTNIYSSFVEQVFYISKRKWKSDIHHHGKTDNLR